MKNFISITILFFCSYIICLGQDQKFLNVVETCMTGNHEFTDCQTLRDAAKQYGLQQLDDYAGMLERKQLDTRRSHVIATMQGLYDYARQNYGEQTLEAIMCQHYLGQLYYTVNWKRAFELVCQAEDAATALLMKHPKNTEIMLSRIMIKLGRINVQILHDPDNPDLFCQILDAEKELEPILKDESMVSPVLVDICSYMATLRLYETYYKEYLEYEYRRRFPKEQYMPLMTYTNGITTNAEAYSKREVRMSRQLWKETDMRCVGAELDNLAVQMRCMSAPYDSVHQGIIKLQKYITDYLPSGDPFVINAELLKRECDITWGQNLDEIHTPHLLLFKARAYFGDDSEEYYSCLYQLTQQMLYVSPLQTGMMLKDAFQSAEQIFKDSPDLLAINLLGLLPVMQALAQDDSVSYRQYINRLTTLYEQHQEASWCWTFTGISLANIYANAMQQADKGCSLFHLALNDIRQLSGGESLLFVTCLPTDVYYHRASTDTIILRQGVEHCKDAIEGYKRHGLVNGEIFPAYSDILTMLNEKDAAEQVLREGINACRKKENRMWRCYLQMVLGMTIYSRQEYRITQEVQQLFEDAIPYFIEHVSEYGGVFLNGYLCVGNYYRALGQYEKAEEILRKGLEQYEMLNTAIDYIYMDFITNLYDLYANELNDLDKAEKMLEGKLEAIRRVPTYHLHTIIWDLLWARYNLIVSKNPKDWILRWAALNDIIKELNLMSAISGPNEHIRELAMPLVYEACNVCLIVRSHEMNLEELRKYEHQELKVAYESEKKAVEVFKNAIKSQVLPILQEREKIICQEGQSGLDRTDAFQIYNALANYYISMEQDTLKAMEGYRRLLKSSLAPTRYMASFYLAGMEMSLGNYSEAATLFDNMEQEEKSMSVTMTNLSSRFKLYWAHGYACYRVGQYQKALELARKNYALRQQQISQNFDLMTESERNALLYEGGTGSDGLLLLLPYFPNQIAGECYDAVLSEKGILLRASERIKRAVLSSDNKELTAQIDSLNRLNQMFDKLNRNNIINTNEQGFSEGFSEEATNLRKKIENLERSINRQAAQYIGEVESHDWKEVQKKLKEGEAAIEYILVDSIPAALVLLHQGEPQYVALKDVKNLHIEFAKLSSLSQKQIVEKLYNEDYFYLYERLWQPIEKIIENAKTIFYSPTGYLNNIAFAAIKCPDGRPLMDCYELHQMLSTGDLVEIRQHNTRQPVKSVVLMGAAYYGQEQINETNVDNKQREVVEDAFEYLPFTLTEVDSVDNMMKAYQIKTIKKTGMEPTEEWLRNQNGQSADVLHLSTHGFYINDVVQLMNNRFLSRFPASRFSSMQRSGLAMVGANDTWEGFVELPEEKDGILTASEVSTLDLRNTRLAVLSACQTALGDYNKEGVFGMQRAFKQAGVGSIIASLWNVNDKSTARLMQLFYQKWLAGTPMQQSLHEAVRMLRKEYASPYYWAPFVLMDAEN